MPMMVNWMVIWHIILCLILIPLGMLINQKLYHNIKNEEHLEKGQIIQRIIKTYSIIQCILWPSCLILSTLLLENSILKELAPAPKFYLTQFSRCLSTFLRHYSAFHSLIIAVSRYVFIVFNGKAEKIGVKPIITANDVVHGDEKLNMAFLATLFNSVSIPSPKLIPFDGNGKLI